MKILICTIPIGPMPNDFPPLGSLAIIQSLREAGYDPAFFDIDGLRPPFHQVVERFRADAPDVVGISAVVSTAYGYVKRLCVALREILPGVRIILGGNLAASAELLHRFCKIDVCVVGEGERIIVNLMNYYARSRVMDDRSGLTRIKGITYLNSDGHMVFTGYEVGIPSDKLIDPDFSILEQYSDINIFINDPFSRPDFLQDSRSYEPHRAGKKMGTVVSSKGCVARCTFCHRWDKGFRQLPPEKVIARIRYLMKRYNVGFIQFGDESFGSDRKATDELIRLIKPLDVLWKVGGIRAGTGDPDRLKRMREAGCVAVYYGFETGSPEILDVMEKKLDLEDNFRATRSTYEAGLYTIYQLVLGMPGETHKTISDTVSMIKQITEFLPDPPYQRLSINYIQALPGTPVYEYARLRGLIGPRLEDEEAYLLSVSDTAAGDDTKFLNFTEYPYLTVQTWRARILYEATAHWYQYQGLKNRLPSLSFRHGLGTSTGWGTYFNLHDICFNPRLSQTLYPVRWLLIWCWTLVRTWRRSAVKIYVSRIWELATWPLWKHEPFRDYRSLRHVMRDIALGPGTESAKNMLPLRLGR